MGLLTNNYKEWRRLISVISFNASSWEACDSALVDEDGNNRRWTYDITYNQASYLNQQRTFDSGLVIKVGSGNTAPTVSDYALANKITSGSISSFQRAYSTENGKLRIRMTFKYSAPSDSDITIKEIGLFKEMLYGTSTSNLANYLFARHVLQTPVTVPANASALITFDIVEE